MRKNLFISFLYICLSINAQEKYPTNYFGKPLEIETILSGTFAELRSNHFHSGIDIKTQQKEGLKVFATAKGYISRIKISPWGYGKAIYILHPNGFTTVYGHLKKFAPEIEAYIKKEQYKQEKFAIELFPEKGILNVIKNELIAYSGNTGGSGGPHLHYEIRDSSQHPMNPMLFGYKIKDSSKPIIRSVYAYSLNDTSQVNNHNEKIKLKIYKTKDGNYLAETIYASGIIGIGLNCYDKQDLAQNKNGVFNIKTFLNGSINYELDFKKFSFRESRHLNQLIDYSHYKKTKNKIQKLFKNESNPLSIVKNSENRGEIIIKEGEQINYKIVVSDFNKNKISVTIPIIGKNDKINHFKHKIESQFYVYENNELILSNDNKEVYIPKNAVYEDSPILFKTIGDTIFVGDKKTPLHKNITISFNNNKYNLKDRSKLYVSNLGYNNTPIYISTYKKDNKIIGKTKSFGKFTLTSDINNPTIKPVNTKQGKWMTNAKTLKMKIIDKESGIKKYRATINNKWALMEYDAKKNLLSYNFNDNIHNSGENKFKLIVIDNVGNNSIFEMTFFRKN